MTLGPGISWTQLPEGFFASGVNSGVRRYRPDLGLIMSTVPATAAGVFTQNQMVAAPVSYCRALLPADNIRAIVTNSGQANAATGEKGVVANQALVDAVAKELECDSAQVLIASTGMIGPQLDLEKLLPAVPDLVVRAGDMAENFALAILTTDLVPKTASIVVELSEGPIRITGICKGSGMIHPNMATMLGYLLTDVKLTPKEAKAYLGDATNVSFNMISVDGDTSTNDAVFLMANGASGVELKTDLDRELFKKALTDISITLAQSIVIDGEGANKLVEVNVVGAPSAEMARRAARGVTVSPLVKTAMHGEDPNWGRIAARLGAEQVDAECLAKMTLAIQGRTLFENGGPLEFDKGEVKTLLRKHKITVDVDLKSGTHMATAWGCDLSKKYVDINTEYST